MAGKQRRPERPPEQEVSGPAVAPPALSVGSALEAAAATQVEGPATAPLGRAGNPLAERITLALCVAPRDAAATARLVEVVSRSALPEARKAEIRDRLLGDQAAADRVASAIATAFGRDDGDLRGALVEGARQATDADLVEVVAAHTGQPEASVRALCDDLAQWVGWWWDEEEDEELPPGDYAAEESGT